jgi:drug/metabolite transporter (DMT)-like permease
VLAWPLQAVALSLGSVALVQPALGFGLVVLLVLGVTVLHESVGRRELSGVAGVAAAVAVLGWAAPSETGNFTTGGTWAVGLALLLVAPAPYLLRVTGRAGGFATSVSAGFAWAWVALGTSLLDVALADRRWVVAGLWAAAVAVVSWGALLAEMTSLQTWPATRAIPVAFGLEMVVPAMLAPALTHARPPHPFAFAGGLVIALGAAALLGTSRAVARAAQPSVVPPREAVDTADGGYVS